MARRAGCRGFASSTIPFRCRAAASSSPLRTRRDISRKQYVALATHGLQLAKVAADHQSRAFLGKMAAEWTQHPQNPRKNARTDFALRNALDAGMPQGL